MPVPTSRPLLAIALALSFASPAFATVSTTAAPVAGPVKPAALGGMGWRLIGPHRAGWGTAVTGVPAQPDTFYFGAAGGGVWKTLDAGRTWMPIFDQGPASVGAIAVAPSDPRVIYVGTGQITTRYDVAAGEGVFKSTDAGRTWTSIGLKDTRHIGSIWVDPANPDHVLVGALGHVFGPNDERGVFRSDDGGRTWSRTLFVSADTGAVDVVADPADSSVVFASVWQVRFRPWMSYFTPDYGQESGIFKSIDGGRHWTRLSGGGWPGGKLGRIGLAATHTATGTRVYAVVDAEKTGGLYRSDDAGGHWQRVNDDGELVNAYFSRLAVAPNDPDTVFAMGRSIRRCSNGGSRCDIIKGSPGGDDYHDIWINPTNPQRMITGSDQGTVVTVDGGATWSSWYNQPTGQLYHLATDNRFPYWIYAGQQDNGTVAIASRTDYGAITSRDWHPVGADERDYDIPDPRNPDIVYGSGLGGRLSRWDARNGEVQNISPWPVSTYGARPIAAKYRYTWITPIAVSGVAPYPLYQGAQVLFRSLDQGATWTVVSPDVAPRDPARGDCDKDQPPEGARACGYGVIFSIGLSPRDNDRIWLGTDDGRVKMTRDGGAQWQDVTPAGVPTWSKISTVDVSALDPATAYIAVDNHRADDFRPMAWRTHDDGRTWAPIGAGLPDGHFVGVVRADTKQRGLLYAGTDRGVWVSFDDGDHWQSLQRNLPSSIVTDLLVHGDDLVVATQGRSIWLMDSLAPLRQLDGAVVREPVHLFRPDAAVRLRGNQNRDTPLPREEPAGRNPPDGAAIDYWLASDAKGPVTLRILDAAGNQVQQFSSDDATPALPAERYFEERWLGTPQRLAGSAGAHRFFWNLRMPRPRADAYGYSIAAIDGDEATLLPEGMLVAPGRYTLVLKANGHEQRTSLDVVADPRVPVDPAAVTQALALSADIAAAMAREAAANAEIQAASKQVQALGAKTPLAPALAGAVQAFTTTLSPLVDGEGEQAPLNMSAIGGELTALEVDLENSDRAPTAPQRAVHAEYAARLERALQQWTRIKAEALPALDAALQAAGQPAIKLAARGGIPADIGVSRDIP
ncbi:WD40/YVTN/BNR-like repeat-containing protein [Cognatiluteimonas profundi]|uniref:WD40/YVTN/BNR-like repeat-containing protein n=1 Tax=Cognatiluteimonas profundi TaxID=2594501 RepID=UPI00131E3E53|nr:exo-alpha-sialidase [Lysobacter profundi]